MVESKTRDEELINKGWAQAVANNIDLPLLTWLFSNGLELCTRTVWRDDIAETSFFVRQRIQHDNTKKDKSSEYVG